MCGIVGFTGPPSPSVLRDMCASLAHRGPDDQGYFENHTISLAMRRLAIVDIESGQQPLANETGDVQVVFNGEIYNHKPLRQELLRRGHRFKTDHSDTEVIVHLYEEYGPEWPQHVNGMFGAAIWDQKKQRLALCRDRIGKKPLYYAQVNQQLIFGSELKAIFKHPAVSREPDFQALYHYFGHKNISAPRTAFADVKQLLPGHILTWQKAALSSRPYWQVYFGDSVNDITEDEAASHLFDLFEDAVKIRMQCDVPYGAYLSGGVDSSAVVAMMCRHQDRPVQTFCLGYDEAPQGQFAGKAHDLQYARQMSKTLQTDHHELIINARRFADLMPKIIEAFDEPFSGTVSTYFLSLLIHQHVKVALSGDGADELFGSYLAHRLAFPVQYAVELRDRGRDSWEKLEPTDLQMLAPFDTPEQFAFLKKIASPRIDAWRNQLAVFTDAERVQLLSDEFLTSAGHPSASNPYTSLVGQMSANDALNQSLEIDQRELLPNQVLPFVDRLSMAHSIEVRVPYLDYRIVEFANRLPGYFKIKGHVVKYIHKKALQQLLPQELLQRPKEGFVQPIYAWMHSSLRDWIDHHLERLPLHVFKTKYLSRLKTAFHLGQSEYNAKIWNLVCFSIWYDQWKAL